LVENSTSSKMALWLNAISPCQEILGVRCVPIAASGANSVGVRFGHFAAYQQLYERMKAK
jgi:hypothetical protein